VPQVMPAFAGLSVFRWDINIRESTIPLNVLAWPQVTVILFMILIAVLISEWVSSKVRLAII